MKRLSLFVVAAALTMVTWSPSVSAAMEEKTIKGEVIDLKCHQGKGHEACATKCVRGGTAVGIKVGDDEVYMIVGDYTNDKNAKLVEFVAKDVEATGEIGEADGHKTINVTAIKLAGV